MEYNTQLEAKKLKALLREIITTVVMAAVIFFVLQSLVSFPASEVISSSMEPTLEIGQRLIISKAAYFFGGPQRGDIVTFRSVNSPGEVLIKRVIGLPGEVVEIIDGTVYIHKADGSDIPLDEPYVRGPARSNYRSDTIPEGQYFMMGDNRNNSADSRGGWTVPRQNIVGKAWLTWMSLIPPRGWGMAPNYRFQAALAPSEIAAQALLAQVQ